MTRRDKLEVHNPMYDTFCLLSYWIIRGCQYLLLIMIGQYVFTTALMFVPSIPFDVWQLIFLFVYRPIIYCSLLTFYALQIALCSELYVMRFIILFEAKYDINELNFIYNNTGRYAAKEDKMAKRLLFTCLTAISCFIVNNCISFVLNSKDYDPVVH